jgi:hypothetical protein
MGKNQKDQKSLMEITGEKMVSEIYPEILKCLKETGGTYVYAKGDEAKTEFELINDTELICTLAYMEGTSWRFGKRFSVLKKGSAEYRCPMSNEGFNPETYLKICNSSIEALVKIRKIKSDFMDVMKKIEALPIELSRTVITEKINGK